jgi:hypothetical protein
MHLQHGEHIFEDPQRQYRLVDDEVTLEYCFLIDIRIDQFLHHIYLPLKVGS